MQVLFLLNFVKLNFFFFNDNSGGKKKILGSATLYGETIFMEG